MAIGAWLRALPRPSPLRMLSVGGGLLCLAGLNLAPTQWFGGGALHLLALGLIWLGLRPWNAATPKEGAPAQSADAPPMPLGRLGVWVACGIGCVLLLRAACRLIPWQWLAGGLLTMGAGGFVVATAWLWGALGHKSPLRSPWWQAPGLALGLLGVLLYVPTMGAHSLTDPWETHYGEVAREMLARNDWLSTWWAQDGWFWSKPVLIFWLQAGGMAAGGCAFLPDQVLAPTTLGHIPHPEWAMRAPVAMMAIGGGLLLYKGLSKHLPRLAAAAGCAILFTSSQWVFIARQTMTDMPFVSSLAAAMGLLLWGISTDTDEPLQSVDFTLAGRRLRFDLRDLLLGCVLVLVVPFGVYLATRHCSVVWSGADRGFYWHSDVFYRGSFGNCGRPGNVDCRKFAPALQWLSPGRQAAVIAIGLGVFVRMLARARNKRTVILWGAFLAAGVSTLAKGPAGLAIPLACVLAESLVRKDWRMLFHLAAGGGALLFLLSAAPWYVAMVARHGSPFVDRLFFHDMWARALNHVHDTNEGVDTSLRYYVWQLGYGLFPWVLLLPLALYSSARSATKNQGVRLLVLWALIGFGLFSAMPTKFHHYIFPIVPPLAMLMGHAWHSLWKEYQQEPITQVATGLLALGLGLSCLVTWDLTAQLKADVVGPARFMYLFTYNYQRVWPKHFSLALPIGIAGGFVFAWGVGLMFRRSRRWALIGGLVVASLLSGWQLNRYFVAAAPHWGQRKTMARYYRLRQGPQDELIAYLMNWKGENFYSGNRVAVFRKRDKSLLRYIDRRRRKGGTTFYFTTEHRSLETLRKNVGSPTAFDVLSDRSINNKFILVRARYRPLRPGQ